jgi:PAS domain S-box-containing protein
MEIELLQTTCLNLADRLFAIQHGDIMSTRIEALLFSDDPGQQQTLDAILSEAASVTMAKDATSFLDSLANTHFHVAFVMSNTAGPQWVNLIASASQYAPVVVIGNENNPHDAVRAMKAGACDYLVPGPDFAEQLREVLLNQCISPGDLPFYSAYQDAPVITFLFDREGIIRDVNARCLSELGYTRETLIGKHLNTLLTSASATHLNDVGLARLWRDSRIDAIPLQYKHQNGTLIDVLFTATMVTHSVGRELAIAVAQNLTLQKHSELAEREQRVLAEALRDTTAALNDTLDFDEVLDRILANVARVVPYDTGNVMLIDGDRARMVRNQRSTDLGREIRVPTAAFEIASTPTLHWMYKHGRPLAIPDTREYPDWVDLPQSAWIRSFVGAPIIEEGRVIGYLTLNSGLKGSFNQQHAERLATFAHHAGIAIRNARLYDAVQRYASELEKRVARRTSQLNLERNQLRAILESTGEGIVYSEADRIEYVNPAFTAMTGYTLDELAGKPLSVIDPNSDRWRSAQSGVLRGEVWRDEIRLMRKDGTEFDAGITISLCSHPGDQRLRTVTVVRDISQAKRLEMQKANFIAIASHELRTPLSNILTRLYLMKREPDKLNEHMHVLNEVTRRMQWLVEDLLDMSRFERGVIQLKRQRVELQQLLSDVVRVQYAEAHTKAIDLSITLTPVPQYVEGDAERLAQVITNLVTNGLTYTPEGGEVHVGLTTQGDNAIITIRDTGTGIAPDYLEQIFEPFVRISDKVKGTGLGLSIAREIVELHGGSISVTSEPGKGSCFTVTLKLIPVMA